VATIFASPKRRPSKVYINSLRVKRVSRFDKIFSKYLWTRPIDEKCEKYALRKWA